MPRPKAPISRVFGALFITAAVILLAGSLAQLVRADFAATGEFWLRIGTATVFWILGFHYLYAKRAPAKRDKAD